MTGVSIVNQLFFVFNLTVFGAISAAGIFTAQYHGLGDSTGEKHTFRFKFLIILIGVAVGIGLFVFYGEELISLFINSNAEPAISHLKSVTVLN